MKQVAREFLRGADAGLLGLCVLALGTGPSLAGLPLPAPLVGMTGPFGLLAAGAVVGGYLLVKRLRNRG
ncbi:MAG: hypothetical protein HY056_11950 [Proteobacteria bacterium]|nr:hypothetical protein [Pseudomonadota bacterium]